MSKSNHSDAQMSGALKRLEQEVTRKCSSGSDVEVHDLCSEGEVRRVDVSEVQRRSNRGMRMRG